LWELLVLTHSHERHVELLLLLLGLLVEVLIVVWHLLLTIAALILGHAWVRVVIVMVFLEPTMIAAALIAEVLRRSNAGVEATTASTTTSRLIATAVLASVLVAIVIVVLVRSRLVVLVIPSASTATTATVVIRLHI